METFENQIHKMKFNLLCVGLYKYQLEREKREITFFNLKLCSGVPPYAGAL